MALARLQFPPFRVERSHIRRGAGFLIGIGVPVLIAASTGQKPGAVMTQLFRARQQLKRLLGGRAAAEGGRT